MSRRVPPSFFFNESDADEDLMAEKDAEKAKAGLDPDALWAAQCAHTDVYDGPGSEAAAIAAAINAYLAAIDEEARPRLERFVAGLQTFRAELEKFRDALEGVPSHDA